MHPMFPGKDRSEAPRYLIGNVARLTGASPRAIRLYESLKLIPRPARRGKYRVYSERDVVVIHMIKRAQAVGFALAEIRDVVAEKARSNRFPLKTCQREIESPLNEAFRYGLRTSAQAIILISKAVTVIFGWPDSSARRLKPLRTLSASVISTSTVRAMCGDSWKLCCMRSAIVRRMLVSGTTSASRPLTSITDVGTELAVANTSADCTRPRGPEPVTVSIATPLSRATRRAAGVNVVSRENRSARVAFHRVTSEARTCRKGRGHSSFENFAMIVAMGITGTDVSKEAADMILTDDNFASIEAAVEEGRGVFDNLTKFIAWTLPTNLGEGLVLLAAIVTGATLPILPIQILWINMVSAAVLGIALSLEPKEPDLMSRKPRNPEAPILNGVLIWRIVLVSIIILAGAFGLFEYELARGASLAEARTVAVNVIIFVEIFYLFNARSLTRSPFQLGFFSNPWAVGGAILMVAAA